MEDIQKLIEKYKQELMELGAKQKRAAPPHQAEWSEQVPDEPPAPLKPRETEQPPEDEIRAEPISRKPEVIGYAEDGDIFSKYAELFLREEDGALDEETETPERGDTPEAPEDAPESGCGCSFVIAPDAAQEPPDKSEDDGCEPLDDPENDRCEAPEEPPEAPPETDSDDSFDVPEETPADEVINEDTPHDYPEAVFDDYGQFERENPGRGTIRFNVTEANGALPIRGAECVAQLTVAGEPRTVFSGMTDESGQTPVTELPAPPKALSQSPENKVQPFALYNARVTAKGFISVTLRDIPVFDGVLSVQNVTMIPDGDSGESAVSAS